MIEGPKRPDSKLHSTVRLSKDTETPPESNVRSTVRLKPESTPPASPEASTEFKLEVGQIITVRDLEVFTQALTRITITGQLTVEKISEKGSPSRLLVGGKSTGATAPERYYQLRHNNGGFEYSVTASESAVKSHLE